MAGEVDIKVQADSKQAEKNFKELEKALKDLTSVLSDMNNETDDAEDGLDDTGDAAKKASKDLGDASKNAEKLKSSLGTIKDVAAGILSALGVANLADGIKDAAEQAFTSSLQMERSAISLERSYTGNSDIIIEWANNNANAFGLSANAATDYAARMQGVLRNLGITDAGIANTLSKNITALSGDFAFLKGVESEEAFEAIRDFLISGGGALEDFGLAIDDTAVSAYAMSNGITDAFDSLDNQNKALIRYNYLLANTKNIQGAFSDSLNTQAGTLASLEIAWNDFITQLGTYARPVLIPVMNGLLTIVAYAGAVLQALAEIYGWDLGVEPATTNAAILESNTSAIQGNLAEAEVSTKETEGNIKDINKAISQGKKLLDLYTLDFAQAASASSDMVDSINGDTASVKMPELTMPEIPDYQSALSGYKFDIDIDENKVKKIADGLSSVIDGIVGVVDAFKDDPAGALLTLVSAISAYGALKFSNIAGGSTKLATGFTTLAGALIALDGGKNLSDFVQSINSGDIKFSELGLSITEFAGATGLLVATLGPGGALVSAVSFAVGAVTDGINDMLDTSKELAENYTQLARGSISERDVKLVEELLPLYHDLESLLNAQALGTVEVDQSEIDALRNQIINMSIELDVDKGEIQVARNKVTEELEKGQIYSVASNLFSGNVDWGKLRGFDVFSAIFSGEVYSDIGGDPIKNLIRNLNALEEEAKKTGKPLKELATGYFDRIMGSKGAFEQAAKSFNIDVDVLEGLRSDLKAGYSELSSLDNETQLLLAQFGTYYIAADEDVRSGTTGVAGLDTAIKEWIARVEAMGYKVVQDANGHLTVTIPFDSHLVGSLDADIDDTKAKQAFEKLDAELKAEKKKLETSMADINTVFNAPSKAYLDGIKKGKIGDSYKGFSWAGGIDKALVKITAEEAGKEEGSAYVEGINNELYNPEKVGQLYDSSTELLNGIANEDEAKARGNAVATALVVGLDTGLTEAINSQGGIMTKLDVLSKAMNSVPDEFREHFKLAIKDINSSISTMQFAFNLMNSISKGNPLASGIKGFGSALSSLFSGGYKNPTNLIPSIFGGTSQPQQSIQSTQSRGNQQSSQFVNLNATIYIGDREINDYIIDVVTNNDNAVG